MDYSSFFGNDSYHQIDYQSLMRNLSFAHNDEDQYKRDLITYYLLGICGMTVCCFGLVGNILSIIVLTRRSMRSSTYSYLCALSICDSFVLLFTSIILIKDISKPVKGDLHGPWDVVMYPYLFPYIHPAAFTGQVLSIWLTLAFTVDRYIMICHPFRAEPFCTVRRARIVVAGLCVTAIIFNIPKYFEYQTVTIRLEMLNQTRVNLDLTEFGKSSMFRQLYHSWFYIIFVCAVPFLALAVLNSFLMFAVHLSRKRGKEINIAEKKRNDTTIMLISVVVVFFICQTPALVSRTIWAFVSDTQAFKKLPLYTLNEIGNFLIVLNSAINIVPYYFFGRRFRRQFWRIFCRCLLGYKKFQKISRSFSMTIIDNRRPSAISGTQAECVNRSVGSKTELQALRKHETLQISTKDSHTPQEPCSSGEPKAAANYEHLRIASLEVNGNCLVSKPKEKLLPRGMINSKNGSLQQIL